MIDFTNRGVFSIRSQRYKNNLYCKKKSACNGKVSRKVELCASGRNKGSSVNEIKTIVKAKGVEANYG